MRTITSSNPNWPLRLEHPDNWEPRETFPANGAALFLRGPIRAEAKLFPSITVEARPGTVTDLTELGQQWVTRRTVLPGFYVMGHCETTLAGTRAIQLDAACKMPYPMHARAPEMIPTRERVVLACQDGKIYEICYRATEDDFDEFLGVFEDLIASFSLDNPFLT